jgi:ferredoxin
VKVLAGEAALSPQNAAEKKHLGNVYFINKVRLACQSRVSGDVTVELPTP